MAKYRMKLVVTDCDSENKTLVRFNKIYEANNKREVHQLLVNAAKGDECMIAVMKLGYMFVTKHLSFQFYDAEDKWKCIDGGHRPFDFRHLILRGYVESQLSMDEAEKFSACEIIKAE